MWCLSMRCNSFGMAPGSFSASARPSGKTCCCIWRGAASPIPTNGETSSPLAAATLSTPPWAANTRPSCGILYPLMPTPQVSIFCCSVSRENRWCYLRVFRFFKVDKRTRCPCCFGRRCSLTCIRPMCPYLFGLDVSHV